MDKKRKLLLIDDDEIQLSVTEYMLMSDYEITTAKSGEEAIELLRDGFSPCLILLDILMPNMDGWETYTKIRSISVLQDVPILFLTVVDGTIEKKIAQKIGAADYITKPFTRKDILTRVDSVIKSKYDKICQSQ